MDWSFQLQKKTLRWLLVVGLVVLTHILFQFLLLPYGNALRSLLPDSFNSTYDKSSSPIGPSLTKSAMVRNPLAFDLSGLKNYSIHSGLSREKDADDSTGNGDIGEDQGQKESVGAAENGIASKGSDLNDSVEVVLDRDPDNEFPSDDVIMDEDETRAIDEEERLALESVKTQQSNVGLALVSEAQHDLRFEQNLRKNHEIPMDGILGEDLTLAHQEFEHANITLKSPSAGSEAVGSVKNITYLKLNGNSTVASVVPESHVANLKNDSSMKTNPGRKKMRCEMPPNSITSIEEMDHILLRHRRSSRSMRPRWSSAHDQEILAARSEIENAPIVANDQDLYAPLFRNVSKFRRSYELMERVLKIYVYKEGKKPVFHVPILKGLYASEGWFMKLMQGNKHFVVKDPRRAHLFYMPFSSRMLEYTIYVRNSHNRTNLRLYLKDYAEKIAAKYRYWNRTGGADHFLVACHDWAPYETRHHMEHCIKALCNADVTVGFKIGRDISLPETYVRSARNPLRDLGGKPASQRHILAFYAGGMHGYLRPILMEHWKDKDPNMKIFGLMPPGVASKMNYIQHMKSSKYCICPRGYEVNSPRVVESIFYECVPVIISDNFVPPFFEVLDWWAFAVILPEKDIPKLREILLSIPEEKYLDLQLGVKKVQRHFLWHAKPMKYDLFNMILHSIWYNRVYQIKPR